MFQDYTYLSKTIFKVHQLKPNYYICTLMSLNAPKMNIKPVFELQMDKLGSCLTALSTQVGYIVP